jgi:adenine phosphoribosyltransferase
MSIADEAAAHVNNLLRDVADFPQTGVIFKDLTPVLADGPALRAVTDAIVAHHGGPRAFDVVAGVEARGFVLGAAVAYAAGVGIVPLRKAGKLPREVHAATYDLEYGEATLEVHTDAFQPGMRALVIDDVLATGGTLGAAVSLVERAGAVVAGISVVLELSFLHGRERMAARDINALVVV